MVKLFSIILLFWSCSPIERSIQLTETLVEIKTMEPYYRDGREVGCMVTWYDKSNNLTYTSFGPDFCDFYIVGAKYKLLIRR